MKSIWIVVLVVAGLCFGLVFASIHWGSDPIAERPPWQVVIGLDPYEGQPDHGSKVDLAVLGVETGRVLCRLNRRPGFFVDDQSGSAVMFGLAEAVAILPQLRQRRLGKQVIRAVRSRDKREGCY